MLRNSPTLYFYIAALATAALLGSACSSSEGTTPTPGGAGNGGGGSGSTASAGSSGATVAGGATNGGGGGAATTGGGSGAGGTMSSGGSASAGSSSTAGAATTGGSASKCIVCDDFESSSTGPDPMKWTIDSSRMMGSATVDAIGAHGSAKSLKVSGGYLKIDTKAGLFTGIAATFWVRLNMRFDMPQPADHVTYLTFTDSGKMGELRLGAQNKGMIWNYSTNDSILPDYNEAANSLSPLPNEWHCFEFEFDSTTPSMHVFMDGQETQKMLLDTVATTGIDDRWMRDMPGWKPQITNFSFGAGDPSPGKVTTWFDDIAISNDRPGCTF